jgi:hypothetical protein
MDAIRDERLRNTKNAKKAISHRVIDTGNSAARKFSGLASEASRPLPLPEMNLASTRLETRHGAESCAWRYPFGDAPCLGKAIGVLERATKGWIGVK